MKRRDKLKIINYAVNEYAKIFDNHYQLAQISNRKIKELLKKYKHSSMCEWRYCCEGLYHNCWQEPYFEGNWDMTQEDVDKIITATFSSLMPEIHRNNRCFVYEKDGDVMMLIVARDLKEYKADYLFMFTNDDDFLC